MRQSLAKYCFYLVFYPWAGVVELADTPDLGSGAARFGGSSPPSRITVHIVLAERLYGLGSPDHVRIALLVAERIL